MEIQINLEGQSLLRVIMRMFASKMHPLLSSSELRWANVVLWREAFIAAIGKQATYLDRAHWNIGFEVSG